MDYRKEAYKTQVIVYHLRLRVASIELVRVYITRYIQDNSHRWKERISKAQKYEGSSDSTAHAELLMLLRAA